MLLFCARALEAGHVLMLFLTRLLLFPCNIYEQIWTFMCLAFKGGGVEGRTNGRRGVLYLEGNGFCCSLRPIRNCMGRAKGRAGVGIGAAAGAM